MFSLKRMQITHTGFCIFRENFSRNLLTTDIINPYRANVSIFYPTKTTDNSPVLESLFNKVAGLHASNFTKKRLHRR